MCLRTRVLQFSNGWKSSACTLLSLPFSLLSFPSSDFNFTESSFHFSPHLPANATLLGIRLNLRRPDREQRMFNSCRTLCTRATELPVFPPPCPSCFDFPAWWSSSSCVPPTHPSPLCFCSHSSRSRTQLCQPFSFSASLKLLFAVPTTASFSSSVIHFRQVFSVPSLVRKLSRIWGLENFSWWLKFGSNYRTTLRQFGERTDVLWC